MNLLLILFIPVVVCGVNLFVFSKEVTLKEFLLQLGAVVGSTALLLYGLSQLDLMDTQVLNGKIVNKARHEVHCRHGYPCNCVTVSCGKGCSTTICQTCYLHSYDVDWDVYTSLGGSFSINTTDLQGLQEPSRWTAIQIGEPYATTGHYKNYVKGNSSTLFIKHGFLAKYKGKIPDYPNHIYDYYHLDRVVAVGAPVADTMGWNRALEQINADLGAPKQCNVILVVVNDLPEDYFYALQEAWLGGKKNDIVIVCSQGADGRFKWVQTMAWSVNSMVKVKISDDLMALGSLADRNKLLSTVDSDVRSFYNRKSFKEFEYLAQTAPLSSLRYILLVLFALAVAIGVSYVIDTNDEREVPKQPLYRRRY